MPECAARQSTGWFSDVLNSQGADLVVGALISGLVGIAAWWFQGWRSALTNRRILGTLLHSELITMAPDDDPIGHDPPTARRYALNAIPLLLSPGVLDPKRHGYLINELGFLGSIVDSFNEKARSYDSAWASGVSGDKLQLLYNDLQMTNSDYLRAHANMLNMLWRLGPPISLEEVELHSFRGTVEFWSSRRDREAWMRYRGDKVTLTPGLIRLLWGCLSEKIKRKGRT